MSKKLINKVDDCVDESLKGFSLLYPGLKLHQKNRFISKLKEESTNNVALLSGGGSGHEPFSAGYVGNGMLSGSVSGSVFASPPKSNILYAIRYLAALYKGGVIVIIPNYTGDCLNFGMAIEHAKGEGIPVTSMSFGEDCASGHRSIAGKRGMCGIILAYKISGGLASSGKDVNYIMNSLLKIHENVSTLGISVAPCSLPGQSHLFTIANDEMELGTGVHGEAGIEKIKIASAKDTVKLILDRLCQALQLETTCSVVVLVNNLGATSQLEQNIICYEVYQQLNERKYSVERIYSGLCFTSLEMAGFQISILRLPNEHKKEWLHHLDFTTDSPSWAGSLSSIPVTGHIEKPVKLQDFSGSKNSSIFKLTLEQQHLFKKCVQATCDKLIDCEPKLNDLDKGCGDGDCGTTLKNLAQGVSEALNTADFTSPERVLEMLSEIAESRMGGTSGAIYSLCFTAMAKRFTELTETNILLVWLETLKEGVNTVMKYSRAQRGDRTIIDAIKPAVDCMYDQYKSGSVLLKDVLTKGLHAAQKGCQDTVLMQARAGRASYVSNEYLTDQDAGAYGFVMILESIYNTLLEECQ